MPSPQPSPQGAASQIPRTLAPMPQSGAVPGAPPPAMSKMPVGVPGAPGPVLMPGVTAAAQPFLAGRPIPGAPAAASGTGSGVAGMPGMPPMPSMPGMPPMPGLPAGRSPSMPGAQPLVGGSGVAGMPGMPTPLAVSGALPGQLPPTGLQPAGMPGMPIPGAHATPPQLMPLRTSTSSSPDPRLPPTGLAPLVAGGPLHPLQPQALQQQGLTSQSQSAAGQGQSNPNQPAAEVPQRGAEEPPSTAASDGVISLAGLVVPSHGARDPATRSIDVTVAEFVWLRERAPVALTATSAKDKKMVTIPAQSVELLAAGPALTAVLAAYLPRPPPSEIGTAARPIMKKDDPASDASPKAKAPRGGAANKQPSALPRDPSAELDGNADNTNEQDDVDGEDHDTEGHRAEKKKADGKDHHVGDPTNPRRVKVVDSGNSPSPARRAHDLETNARYHPSVDSRHAEWSAIQKSCQRLKFSLPLDAIAAVVATRDAPQLRRVIAELYRGVRRHDLAVKSTKAKTGALTSGPSSSKFTKNAAGAAVAAGRAGGPAVGPGRAIPHRLEPMDRGAARAIASGHPTAGLPHSTSPSPARAAPLSAGSPMKHSSVAGALEHVGAHNSGVVSSAVYPGAPPRFKRKVRKDASCQTEGLCIILPIDKPPPMTGWISDPIWRSAIPGGVARIGAGTKSSKAPADENVSPAVAHGVQQAKARVGAAGAGQTVPVSERPEWVSGKARRAVPVSTSAAELRDHRTRDDPDHKLRKKTRGVVNENDSATASTSASPTKQQTGGGATPSISAASAVPSSVAEKQSPANLRYESEAKKRELQEALAGGGQGIVKHLSLNDDDDATPQHDGDGGAPGEEAQQEDAGDAEGTAVPNDESNDGVGEAGTQGGAEEKESAEDGGADAENTASNGRFTFGFTEDESRADDATGGDGALRSDGDSDSDADQNDDEDERPSTAADREKAEVEAFTNFHRAVSFGGPLHAMKSKKSENENGGENEGADNEGDDGTRVTFGRGAGGGKKVKRRPTVCAEAITDADLDAFVPDVIEKSDPSAREFLKAVLEKHELFSHLEDHELYVAVDAMQEAERGEGDVLFEPPMDGEAPTSDDDGDTFFVVGSGRVALRTKQSPEADATAADSKASNDTGASKQDDAANEVDDEGFQTISVLESGATTQELMLMYPAPHTEKGVALDDGTVTYMLDRKTYRSVLSQASKKKRALYEGFLSTVSFLEHLDKRDLLQLADALKPATYAPGEHLITYGEKGKNFFLIVEGTVEVFGRDKDGNKIKVCEFTVGDCVGELEFINHHDCVADVVAKGRLDDDVDADDVDVDVEDKSEGENNGNDHQSSDSDEHKDDEENPGNSASAAKPTPANVTKLNLNNARPTSADAYAMKAEAKKEGAEVGTTEGGVENAMSGVLSARAAAAMKQLSPRITAEVIASMTATGFVGVRAAKMNRRHFEMVMGPCRDVLARNAEENKKYAYYRGKLDAIKDAREEGRADSAEGPETAAEEPAVEGEVTEVTKRDLDAAEANAAEGSAVEKAEAYAEGAAVEKAAPGTEIAPTEDVDPKPDGNGSAGDDTTAADAASVVAAVVAAAVEMNQERRDEAVASAAAPPSTSDNAAAQENTTAPADASNVPEDEADDIDIGEGGEENGADQKSLEEEGDDALERTEKEEEEAAEAAHETGDGHNDTVGEGDADPDLEPAEEGGEEEAAEEAAEEEEYAEEEDGSPNEEAEAEKVEEGEEGEGQAEGEEEYAEDGDPDADGEEGEGEAEAEEEAAAVDDEEVGDEEENGDVEDAAGNNATEGEHEGAEAAAGTDATKKIVIDTDDI